MKIYDIVVHIRTDVVSKHKYSSKRKNEDPAPRFPVREAWKVCRKSKNRTNTSFIGPHLAGELGIIMRSHVRLKIIDRRADIEIRKVPG